MNRDVGVSTRPCPMCSGSERSALFRQGFAPVEAASLMSGYDVVVCSECGGGFADGLPPQAVFDAYYRKMSKYEYHQRGGVASDHDLARFEVIADLLVPLLLAPRGDSRCWLRYRRTPGCAEAARIPQRAGHRPFRSMRKNREGVVRRRRRTFDSWRASLARSALRCGHPYRRTRALEGGRAVTGCDCKKF